MKGRTVSTRDRGKLENPYSEMGDLVVDRLLLRYLSPRISHARCGKTALAYLIVSDSLTKSFDKFRNLSGITPLVYEPGNLPFI